MTNIIHLIKKDFLTVFLSKKHILFVAIAFIIAGISLPAFVPISFTMMLYALFFTPTYYEEISGADYLIATLPISKCDYVLSKYITLLIEMLFSLVYSLILFIVSMSLSKITLTFSDILTFVCMCLFIGLLYISIIIPVVLKFGFANIRYVFIFIAMGEAILASTASDIIINTPTLQNLLSKTSTLILVIFIIISILFITSIFTSIWIYNKKELLE